MLAALILPDEFALACLAASAAGLALTVWLTPRRGLLGAVVLWLALIVLAGAAVSAMDGTSGGDPLTGGYALEASIVLLVAAAVLLVVSFSSAERRSRQWQADAETAKREVERLTGVNVRIEDEIQDLRRRARGSTERRAALDPEMVEAMARMREAYDDAARASRRHRRVFDACVDGMAFLERETLRLAEVNDTLAKMLGRNRADLTRLSVIDLFGGGPTRPGRTDLQRCARDRRVLRVPLLRADGGELPAEITIGPVGEGDEAKLLIVVREAVAPPVAAPAAAPPADLERAAEAERSREALEARLRDAEAAARRMEEVSARKDAYLSTVAHELRTPLTSIRSFSEILLRHGDVDAAARQEFLAIIEKESLRLSRLVNDVLDLARIDAGASRLAPTDFDARAVLDDAVASLGGYAGERGVCIDTREGAGPRPLHADRDRVQQLLVNLIGNAIKFGPEGGVVTVSIDDGAAPGALRFVVRDRGPGIPQEELETVFERFRRGKGGESADGTGLGLAISREIAHLHGGRVWAENHPQGGAMFVAEFPAPRAKRADEAAPAPRSSVPVPVPVARPPAREPGAAVARAVRTLPPLRTG